MPERSIGRWRILNEIRGGGQGRIYDVQANDDPAAFGILKELKNNKDLTKRLRMQQEIASLRILKLANANVPAVLDENAGVANDPSFPPLFLVTEKIEGETLRELIERTRGLELDVAVRLILSIARTVEIAHKTDILHRDLHPGNIIVRSIDPADVVLIDFGLSFNKDEGDGPTGTTEPFKNWFFDVPGHVIPGADRRDQCNDVLYLPALLHYAMTGQIPGHPRDGDNRPPHRRPDGDLRKRYPGDPRVPLLENLLDSAFAAMAANRFQTAADFANRLEAVSAMEKASGVRDPIAVARAASQIIRRRDRKTRLAEFAETAAKSLRPMLKYMQEAGSNLEQFRLGDGSINGPIELLGGLDYVGPRVCYMLTRTHDDAQRLIVYQVGFRGDVGVLVRRTYERPNPKVPETCASDPVEVVSFDGEAGFPSDIAVNDLKEWIAFEIDGFVADLDDAS